MLPQWSKYLLLRLTAVGWLLPAAFAGWATELVGTDLSCPSSPNCVSSLAKRSWQHIEPLPLAQERDWQGLLLSVPQLPGCQIVAQGAYWLRAECTSKNMGYIDDLTLIGSLAAGRVELRSQSREGWYDLHVNSRRAKRLRHLYQTYLGQPE